MNLSPEQQKRIHELCRMISDEQDASKVTEYARELSELLEAKTSPTTSEAKTPSTP